MSYLPNKTCEYANAKYWDERFKEEEEREWCQQYDDFKYLLQPLIKLTDLILIVGCGNSKLGQNLAEAGYQNVVNCDISPTVLHKMSLKSRRELKNVQQMQWICCNMLNLPFRIGTFDVIIEKGTLDVWFTEDSQWNVSVRTLQRMQHTLDGIFNCLKISGKFVSITFSDPYFRMKYYENQRYNWKAQCQRFGNDFHYYFYTMTKFNNQIGSENLQVQNKQGQNAVNKIHDIKPMHEYMDEEDYVFKISEELMD